MQRGIEDRVPRPTTSVGQPEVHIRRNSVMSFVQNVCRQVDVDQRLLLRS